MSRLCFNVGKHQNRRQKLKNWQKFKLLKWSSMNSLQKQQRKIHGDQNKNNKILRHKPALWLRWGRVSWPTPPWWKRLGTVFSRTPSPAGAVGRWWKWCGCGEFCEACSCHRRRRRRRSPCHLASDHSARRAPCRPTWSNQTPSG